MNSVNSVAQNFVFMVENNKKYLLLFGDSRFDENKNKVNLEATTTFIKKYERFTLPKKYEMFLPTFEFITKASIYV